MDLPAKLLSNRVDDHGSLLAWDTRSVHDLLASENDETSVRTTERTLENSELLPAVLTTDELQDEHGRQPRTKVLNSLLDDAKKKRWVTLVIQSHTTEQGLHVLFSNDLRGGRRWVYMEEPQDVTELADALAVLTEDRNALLLPHGEVTRAFRALQKTLLKASIESATGKSARLGLPIYQEPVIALTRLEQDVEKSPAVAMNNLDRLEADSIPHTSRSGSPSDQSSDAVFVG